MTDETRDRGVDKIITDLLRSLELGEGVDANSKINLFDVFGECMELSQVQFDRVSFDLSLLAGVSGDWQFAYDLAVKLEESSEQVNVEMLKIWQIRCLFELERFSEMLAIVRARNWSDSRQIHVNYLAGMAFLSLGMSSDAKVSFDAVNRKNPNYQDIALKLIRD